MNSPRLTDQMTVGDRIAHWRRYRGMTQEVCAGQVGKSRSWWQKVELGVHVPDKLADLVLIAKMFRVPALEDITGPLQVPLNQDRTDQHELLTTVSQAVMDANDPELPTPNEPIELGILRDQLDHAVETLGYSRNTLTNVGRLLPTLLISTAIAFEHAPDETSRRRAARIGARVNILAAQWFRDASAFEWAGIVTDRAMTAARNADDPASLGLASWATASVLKSQGRFEAALDMCHRGLRILEPSLDQDRSEALPIYGHLQFQAGLSAGHCGEEGTALRAWDAGNEIAQRLGPGHVHPQTWFCAANAGVFHLRTWAALGNTRQVLTTSRGLDINSSPTVTDRGLAWIDAARNYVADHEDVSALKHLETAHRQAPELVRHNVHAREAIRTMMLRDDRSITRDLHDMARRVGIFA